MKSIAILVIAAVNNPLYIHYLNSYWKNAIKYTNKYLENVDIFLLFEYGTDLSKIEIKDNIIIDKNSKLETICNLRYQNNIIPGILSKTVFAFDLLKHRYDVFFRTNLSSLIKISKFNKFVQEKNHVCYSGNWVWKDGLRNDLIFHNRIGNDKSIKSLAELDQYEGNTFISGAGYFLNSEEVKSLVRRRDIIRYDIVDDVSVGLMFKEHEMLPGFSYIVEPDKSVDELVNLIRDTDAVHIRLQHFPLHLAEELWSRLETDPIWK